jgi:hypothetical protein
MIQKTDQGLSRNSLFFIDESSFCIQFLSSEFEKIEWPTFL